MHFSDRPFELVLACLLALALALGCEPEEDADGTDDTAAPAVSAPAVASLADTLAVDLTLPEGVLLPDVIAGADGAIDVGTGGQLGGELATLVGEMKIGVRAVVGDSTAGGDVLLAMAALVEGDLVTTGTVTARMRASVTGSTVENAMLGPPGGVSWVAEEPMATLGDVELVPSERRDLEPAIYGALTAQPNSTVVLHTGVYVFDEMVLHPGTELVVEDADGPVQVYVHQGLSYKGAVRSAYDRIPQLLVVAKGSEKIHVHEAFTGVLIAPNAEIHVASGLPDGHRAAFHGASVRFDPNAVVQLHPFDWVEVAGADLQPDVEGEIPVHDMPNSPGDLSVGLNGDGSGSASGSGSSDVPIDFTLPESYPVGGGIIGNGTVIFEFWTPEGVLVTCTYQGASPTAAPVTAEDLTLGRLLEFVGCSDGLPADAPREGTDFGLSVTPAPGYPVSVRSPIQADGFCSGEMELITPQRTRSLRQAFDWDDALPVAERNPDGTPTLYYAWVYVRDPDEMAAMRKLYIHILTSPLFTEELDAFAGRCGVFTNPGDGEGIFVPALIPGITYNRLIAALDNDDIEGDRVVFDAVVLRDVPAAARNGNGSVRLDVLAESGFRYLSYEPNPLPEADRLDLASGAAKVFVDALTFVAEGLRDLGEEITNTLARLDRLFRDEVTMTLYLHGITGDEVFGTDSPVMIRGWGSLAGRELAAQGLEVTILQKLFDSPIPTTSQGSTNSLGRVVIDAVKDGEARGSGLCVELKNHAVRVTDFLLATKLCDLRGFDPENTTAVGNFELDDFSESRSIDVHLENLRLVGLYQADDVYRYARGVMRFRPRRAKLMSGYWADTFSSTNPDGSKRLYAPCLGFPNTVTDAMVAASFGVGLLATIVVPTAIVPVAAATFAAIIGTTDVVMSTNSALEESREVMSHEYGHYLFCATLYRSNPVAVDHLVWTIIAAGDDLTVPTRYLHEGMADFFTGQVVSGNDYQWLNNTTGGYCDGRTDLMGDTQPCWDNNERDVSSGPDDRQSIGRVASLVHDAFDGQGGARRANLPGDGDAWLRNRFLCADVGVPWECCTGEGTSDPTEPCNLLDYTPFGYGNLDSQLERVALDGPAFLAFADGIASWLGPFSLGDDIDDPKIFESLDDAMAARGVSWCDRCRVLALHSDTDPDDTIGALFRTCLDDPLISGAMPAPPDPFARLDAATCTVCPDNHFSNEDGVCEECDVIVVGNTCSDIPPVD